MSSSTTLPLPAMLRGSLVRLRRKCGKPSCRCANGDLHQSWVLSYSHAGRTRMVALRQADVPLVKEALRAYLQASKRLDQEAMRGIAQLRARLRHRRSREGSE